MLVSKKTRDKLKCCICQLYLSVPPITRTQKGFCCGRCSRTSQEREILYETAVENLRFPCRYLNNGCMVTMMFGRNALKHHENLCDYRTFGCFQEGCEVNLNKFTWLNHFKEHHLNRLNVNTLEVTFKLEDNITKRSYIVVNNQIYAVTIKFRSSFGFLALVRFFLETGDKKDSTFKVSIRSQSNSSAYFTQQGKIALAGQTAADSDYVHIKMDKLKTIDKQEAFVAKVKLPEKHSCTEYVPFYFICPEEHRCCPSCGNADTCPKCNKSVEVLRNSNPPYYDTAECCNKFYGCKYRAKLHEVLVHEKTCTIYFCPLQCNGCNKRFIKQEMFQHVYIDHQTPNLLLDSIPVLLSDKQSVRSYFFSLNSMEFIVLVYYWIKESRLKVRFDVLYKTTKSHLVGAFNILSDTLNYKIECWDYYSSSKEPTVIPAPTTDFTISLKLEDFRII